MNVPGWLNTAGFLLALLALVGTSTFSRRRYLFLAGFLLPLLTPGLSVGVNVLFFNYLGLIALAILPMVRGARLSEYLRGPVKWLILYVLILSAAWTIADFVALRRYVLAESIGLAPAQAKYRIPVQAVSFVAQLLAFYIVPSRARSARDALAGIVGFVAGLGTSTAFGLVVLVTTGHGTLQNRAVVVESSGLSIARLGGLSGEPKMLGAFLVVGIVLLVAFLAGRPPERAGRYHARLLGVLAVGLVLTLSTSAWLAVGAGLAALALLRMLHPDRTRAALWAGMLLVAAIGSWQVPVARDLFQERVSRRVFDSETQELDRSKDHYVYDVYSDHPGHMIFGFGMGGMDFEAVPYLLRDSRYRAERRYVRTPTASVNITRLFGDLGLVGLLLLGGVAWTYYRRFRLDGQGAFALFAAAGLVAIMFVGMNAIAPYMFVLGATVALGRSRTEHAP